MPSSNISPSTTNSTPKGDVGLQTSSNKGLQNGCGDPSHAATSCDKPSTPLYQQHMPTGIPSFCDTKPCSPLNFSPPHWCPPCNCPECSQQWMTKKQQPKMCKQYAAGYYDWKAKEITDAMSTAIRNRWKKKSQKKREDLLLVADPNMYPHQWCEARFTEELLRHEAWRWKEFPNACLVPYISLEALKSDPSKFLNLLFNRVFFFLQVDGPPLILLECSFSGKVMLSINYSGLRIAFT
jgi:hypothetical protein